MQGYMLLLVGDGRGGDRRARHAYQQMRSMNWVQERGKINGHPPAEQAPGGSQRPAGRSLWGQAERGSVREARSCGENGGL